MYRIYFKLSLFTILLFLFVTGVMTAQEDFRKNPPAAGPARPIMLGESVQFELKNGLKVIVVENHKVPRVSFQVFVDRAPILEKEYAGYVSIAGSMLDKGTTSRTKAEIDEAIDFIGASLSVSGQGVFGSCLTKHQDVLLELLTDVLYHPSFPEAEFEKIKKQNLSALLQSKENPESISSRVSNILLYGVNHPYGETTTEESLNSITLEQCKDYYNTYFKPNISYLIIVGDIQVNKAKELAEKHFGTWKAGEMLQPAIPETVVPKLTTVNFVDKPGAVQSVINITYPVKLHPSDPDIIKARVLNTILGGGFFGSRLIQNIREDKGYTYGAYSSLDSDLYSGSFSAGASVRNEVTDSAIVQFFYEMNRIKTELVSDKDLELAKNNISGSFSRQLESPQTVARLALNIARYNLPKDYYEAYLEKLNAVTKEDILEMAKKYIKPEAAYVVVVGNKDEVAEKLIGFAADKTIHEFDGFGNPKVANKTAIEGDVTASNIIDKYLDVLGGREKIAAVENIKMVSQGEVQGMQLQTTQYFKMPNKMRIEVAVGGNVMQKVVFDGVSGYTEAMGQKQEMPEEAVASMKLGNLFPELRFDTEGYEFELKEVETIDNQDAYKIVIKDPVGKSRTSYYSIESGFKIREITSEGGVTQTIDFSDFKPVEGIMFPHTTKLSGVMPFTLSMTVSAIEVNGALEADLFDRR